MNNYGESLLTSMSILFKDTLEKEKIARVVEALVVDLLDSSVGLYSIKYENQILKAYSNNVAIKYNKNDRIYVLCQDGSLDGSLIIIGAKNPYSGLYTPNAATKYIPVGDSLYVVNVGNAIELCTYQSDMSEEINFSYYGEENYSSIFNYYLEKYSTFCFQFNVQTNITDVYQRVDGDYGLRLRLPFINRDGEKVTEEFVFNIDKMLGDVYNFASPAPQTLYVKFDEGLKVDTTRNPVFTAFVKDFKRDVSITTSDIFITDVSFYPVDVLNESSLSGYYLSLSATEGNFFAGDYFNNTKVITPKFLIDGVETTLSDIPCYWFVEDASITKESEGYNNKGGTGWRLLEIDNTNPSLEISVDSIKTSSVYKAVIVYNNSLVSQTIKIENLNSNIKIEVKSKSNIILEGNGDVFIDVDVLYQNGYHKTSDETLVYEFSRYDYQGNYIDNDFYDWILKNKKIVDGDTETYSSEIKFPCEIITNGMNTIMCSVYSLLDGDKILIGTQSLAIVTTPSSDYILSMQNADYLYKYDADGDSPACEAYDGPISSIVREIKPLSFKIYKKDGTEFDDTEYAYCRTIWELPINSMMNFELPTGVNISTSEDGLYTVVEGSGKIEIPYSINNVYDINKNNNTARLTVHCDREGYVVKGTTNILFSKDGEAGTNGTKYAVMITYNGYTYGEPNAVGIPNKFQLVWANDTHRWYRKNPITNRLLSEPFTSVSLNSGNGFNIKVFADGEQILNPLAYEIEEWSLFDERHLQPYFEVEGETLKWKNGMGWTDPTESKACILQVKVKVADADVEGKDLVAYAYYPIEISYIAELSADLPVPLMQNGFDIVTYANDGTNPRYNSAKPFTVIDGLYNDDIEDLYDYSWTGSSNLTRVGNSDSQECKFTPKSKYDNGETNNYVKATLSISASKIQEIQDKIDELQAESDALVAEILNKDNILATLNSLTSLYKIRDWQDRISQSEVLSVREMMINSCNSSIELLNQFKDVFAMSGVTTSYPYMSIYNTRKGYIETALSKLRGLNKNVNLSGLSALDTSSIKIELTPAQSGIIQADLGEGGYQQVLLLVTAYNTSIDIYRSQYNNIMLKSSQEVDGLHTNYNEICQGYTDNTFINNLKTLDSDEFSGFCTTLTYYGTLLENNTDSKVLYQNYLNNIETISQNYINADGSLNPGVIAKYDSTQDKQTKLELDGRIEALTQQLTVLSAITMTHLKPIVFVTNRYGYSYLNEWDGNKIYVNEAGDYILSPLVGAGKKEQDNSYTGLLMGSVKEGLDTKVGLIGLSKGERSIFLDAETGLAEFGVSGKGQIILDPRQNKAELKSGNYDITQGTGMKIDLTTPEIRFGSGNFVVNSDGRAVIKGGGDIAGWSVNEHDLRSTRPNSAENLYLDSGDVANNILPNIHSNTHNGLNSSAEGFYLGSDGLSIGNHFKYAQENGAYKLTLGKGNKKWTVESNGSGQNEESYLSYNTTTLDQDNNNSVYLGTDGIRLGDKFKVTREGTFKLGKWRIDDRTDVDPETGTTTKQSYFSYGFSENVEPTYQGKNNSIYIGTDGISLGTKFGVRNDGSLEAKKGTIADFTIEDDKIYDGKATIDAASEGIYLGTNGISLGYNNSTQEAAFKVNRNGVLTSTKGTIGGWTIDKDEISIKTEDEHGFESSLKLKNDGSIRGSGYKNGEQYEWKLSKDGTITARVLILNSNAGDGCQLRVGSNFSVDSNGQLQCQNANVKGIITAQSGKIGDFTIENGALYTGYKYDIDTEGAGIHFSESGIAINDTFKVTADGFLNASSGLIGGITLDQNGLVVMDTTVTPPKVKFRINKNGTINCNYLTCGGGTIGSLTVSGNQVTVGDLQILSSGTIKNDNISISGDTIQTTILNHTGASLKLFNRSAGYAEQEVVYNVVLNADGTVSNVQKTTLHYLSLASQ